MSWMREVAPFDALVQKNRRSGGSGDGWVDDKCASILGGRGAGRKHHNSLEDTDLINGLVKNKIKE